MTLSLVYLVVPRIFLTPHGKLKPDNKTAEKSGTICNSFTVLCVLYQTIAIPLSPIHN